MQSLDRHFVTPPKNLPLEQSLADSFTLSTIVDATDVESSAEIRSVGSAPCPKVET